MPLGVIQFSVLSQSSVKRLSPVSDREKLLVLSGLLNFVVNGRTFSVLVVERKLNNSPNSSLNIWKIRGFADSQHQKIVSHDDPSR